MIWQAWHEGRSLPTLLADKGRCDLAVGQLPRSTSIEIGSWRQHTVQYAYVIVLYYIFDVLYINKKLVFHTLVLQAQDACLPK